MAARRAGSRGTTLIEVLVAMLVLGAAVAMIFTVSMATQQGQAELQPFEDATLSIDQLSGVLRNFVTADASAVTTAFAPGGSWRLPGDDCAYALQAGCVHAAAAYLDPRLRARHPGARLTYQVVPAGPDGEVRVDFEAEW